MKTPLKAGQIGSAPAGTPGPPGAEPGGLRVRAFSRGALDVGLASSFYFTTVPDATWPLFTARGPLHSQTTRALANEVRRGKIRK